MKVQLVVVQGKPEGKIIPLLGPVFRIGRGETCHLRPNSDLVSREHAEFTIGVDSVAVKDSLFARAADEGWSVVLSHEAQQPIGRLVRDRDRYRYEGR